MDSRWARVARGWSAAAFATFVAAFSHGVAGGVAPSAFGILVSLVISGMICTVFTARHLSLWRLAVSLGLSQVLFHVLFGTLASPTAPAHDMTTMTMDAAAHPHADPTMWLAHAAAALVTVLAFRHAESAFWGVAGTARLLLSRLLAVVVPVPATAPRGVEADREVEPRIPSLLLSAMRHRGPPAGLPAR
jgi:hypothetical protein